MGMSLDYIRTHILEPGGVVLDGSPYVVIVDNRAALPGTRTVQAYMQYGVIGTESAVNGYETYGLYTVDESGHAEYLRDMTYRGVPGHIVDRLWDDLNGVTLTGGAPAPEPVRRVNRAPVCSQCSKDLRQLGIVEDANGVWYCDDCAPDPPEPYAVCPECITEILPGQYVDPVTGHCVDCAAELDRLNRSGYGDTPEPGTPEQPRGSRDSVPGQWYVCLDVPGNVSIESVGFSTKSDLYRWIDSGGWRFGFGDSPYLVWQCPEPVDPEPVLVDRVARLLVGDPDTLHGTFSDILNAAYAVAANLGDAYTALVTGHAPNPAGFVRAIRLRAVEINAGYDPEPEPVDPEPEPVQVDPEPFRVCSDCGCTVWVGSGGDTAPPEPEPFTRRGCRIVNLLFMAIDTPAPGTDVSGYSVDPEPVQRLTCTGCGCQVYTSGAPAPVAGTNGYLCSGCRIQTRYSVDPEPGPDSWTNAVQRAIQDAERAINDPGRLLGDCTECGKPTVLRGVGNTYLCSECRGNAHNRLKG